MLLIFLLLRFILRIVTVNFRFLLRAENGITYNYLFSFLVNFFFLRHVLLGRKESHSTEEWRGGRSERLEGEHRPRGGRRGGGRGGRREGKNSTYMFWYLVQSP
jgi:hypothetical protein